MNRRTPGAVAGAVVAISLLAGAAPATDSPNQGPVRVFILAGQSNMEGKSKNRLWDYQAEAPDTKDFFAYLRKDGKWIVRDNVFIKFLGRKGPLTIGFGSPGCTGSELEFGTMMGDKFEEPVLLIKAAWGGNSLHKPFRPPSAGLPSEEKLQKELEHAAGGKGKKKALQTMDDIKQGYGEAYRKMMTEVQETFANYATLFPELKGRKLELTGFFWFQGFNDIFSDKNTDDPASAPNEYASNMKHFISDVRKDLGAPNLPFVIAAIGVNGSKPAKGGLLTVQNAQMAMNDVPEFKGNVKAFRNDLLVDKRAEELYKDNKNNLEEWQKVGSDRPYHYYGSAIWYTRIGHAAGEAMLELMKKQGQ